MASRFECYKWLYAASADEGLSKDYSERPVTFQVVEVQPEEVYEVFDLTIVCSGLTVAEDSQCAPGYAWNDSERILRILPLLVHLEEVDRVGGKKKMEAEEAAE